MGTDSPITVYARVAEVSAQRYSESTAIERKDVVALEEPLKIALKTRQMHIPVALTMRSPGDDHHLALGLLFAEGIINSMADIERMETHTKNGRDKPFATSVTVHLQPHVEVHPDTFARQLPSTSSCGVCGRLQLPELRSRPTSETRLMLTPKEVYALSDRARAKQILFQHTGGIHSAARFSKEGLLVDLAEDIGRHNALDKLVGRALTRDTLPWTDNMLLLSGRVSYELMQKAIGTGIKIILAIGAPSALAVEMAHSYGITLVGFLKADRFNVYAGHQRITN